MSALPAVSALSTGFDPYVRQGWHLCPIPPNTKGPKLPGWNRIENTITDPNKIPNGYGVGLCHAYSGTMALDIDDWDRAVFEFAKYEIDLPALYAASDAVVIDSGREGHGKLLYAMPFGMSLTSKKLIETMPDGTKRNYIDFRCATASGLSAQDVLPPTIHPVTCKPYQWAGKGDWRNLPQIPSALLNVWQGLLAKDLERVIVQHGTVNASWDEVKQALDHINPDINRDEWVAIGMALHYAGHSTNQVDQALMLWDDWSSQGSKYQGQQDIMNCWKSFKVDPSGVKLGTLFHYATQAGWTRPVPDVAYLFKEVIPQGPKSIIDGLVIKPPVCPIDLFPEVLVTRAKVVQREYAADPIMPIFAGLAAASAAADKRIRLRLMADWKVPPVLWTMTIGSPSAKKTPATTPMYEVLKAIQAEDMPRYLNECLLYEALDSAYAASKKAYLQAAGDPHNMLTGALDTNALPIVTQKPEPPVKLRLTVSDITSQKLIRMAAQRPRGLVCTLDEMRSWAEKLSNPTTGEDRSTWVEGYNCLSKELDRVGDGKTDGDLYAEHFALGVSGNIQPKVLTERLPSLTADGVIQRFIFAVVDDSYSDVINEPSAADAISKLQYEEAIRRIYALPVAEYNLSESAYKAFREFQMWYLCLKQDERLIQASDAYQEALGKIEGTCGRIMLIMHLLTNPEDIAIPEKTAQDAIKLVRDYIVPSMRFVYGGIEGIDAGSLDNWVLDHVLYSASQVSTMTLSELRRSARQQIRHMSHQRADIVLLDAMGILEQNGWVSLLEQNGKTTKWAINPVIKDLDKEYRRSVIEARQRIYDDIHRTSGGKAKRRIAYGMT